MNFEDTFTLCVEDGEEIECEIVFIHKDENTGKKYIVYTETDECDYEDELNIYSGLLKTDKDGNESIVAIETEQEQQMIDNLIDDFFDSIESVFDNEE